MAGAKFLDEKNLLPWLEELGGRYQVLAPRADGDSVVFKPFDKSKGVLLTRDATVSPKQVLFPASECLMTYTKSKDSENPGRMELEVQEPAAPAPTVVFGARPCGVRGFEIFDRVYLNGRIPDPYYTARREATLFVSLACATPEPTCFCHWTGGGPADTAGSDVLLTPVRGGWLVEAVTARGESLLSSPLLAEAGDKAGEADEVKARAEKSMGQSLDLSDAPAKFNSLFGNLDFWGDVSAGCLSCGACTYLCPTCYCFNITDETKGQSGKRLRSWDNCMSFQFTLEASGHNPRPTKAHRFRNRIGHKFSYYPELHGGTIACCGCGRCIKSCPSGVDVRDILARILAHQPQKETSEENSDV